jgi:hypothetical protein
LLQVQQYLVTYAQTSPELPTGELSILDDHLAAALAKHSELQGPQAASEPLEMVLLYFLGLSGLRIAYINWYPDSS